MKRTYLNSILFALIMVFSTMSCEDLEERPVGTLSPEGLFVSVKELKAGVNGAYGQLAREEFHGRKLTLALLLRSDMVVLEIQVLLPDDMPAISCKWNRTMAW